jgi:hypothetical protein
VSLERVALDTDLRPVVPAPPMGDGYRTAPGSTHRNGLPGTHPYAWNDGGDVAGPREIVRALHRQLGLRYYGCCKHCEHDAGDPPHTIRCDAGCNDSQDGEEP